MRFVVTSFLLFTTSIGCQPTKKNGETGSTSEKDDGGSDSSSGANAGTVAITAKVDSKYTNAVPFQVSGSSMGDAGRTEAVAISAGSLAIDISAGQSLLGDKGESEASSTVIMVMEGDADDRLAAFDSMKFVAAPTGGADSLIGLATSEAKVSDIDLGTVASSGDDLVGDKVVGTDQFDIGADVIKEMATVDDAMRSVKNSYANYSDAGSISAAQEFYWQGKLDEALGTESKPSSVKFVGWSPQLQISHPDFTFATLCDPNVSTYKMFEFLLPKATPRCSNDDCTTTDSVAVLSNAGAVINQNPNPGRRECSSGYTYMGIMEDGGKTSVFMNFGSGLGFQGEIPVGTWTLRFNNNGQTTLLGKYDLAASYPLIKDPDDATKMVPRVYIPAVELETEATGKVAKANIWFYLYDKDAKEFKKVTDYTTMKSSVGSFMFGGEGRTNGANVSAFDLASQSNVSYPENNKPFVLDFSKASGEWRAVAGDTKCSGETSGYHRLETVGVDYSVYGNRFKFWFQIPGC